MKPIDSVARESRKRPLTAKTIAVSTLVATAIGLALLGLYVGNQRTLSDGAPSSAQAPSQLRETSNTLTVYGHLYPVLYSDELADSIDHAGKHGETLFLGDYVALGDYEKDYAKLKELTANAEPLFTTGNHETDIGVWNGRSEGDKQELNRLFEDNLNPRFGLVVKNDINVVYLDTSVTPRGQPYDIDDEQAQFLESTLIDLNGSSMPTVVALHHCLWAFPEDDPNPRFKGSDWLEEIHPMLQQAGVKTVLCGDSSGFKLDSIDGIEYIQSGFSNNIDAGGYFLQLQNIDGVVEWKRLYLQQDMPAVATYEVTLKNDRTLADIDLNGTKATLLYDGKEYDATVALRGDTEANRDRNKRSYRIDLDSEAINGRTEFKFYIPQDRRYIAESFNRYTAEKLGLLSPLIENAQLTINDQLQGNYYVIEDFDKAFVETKVGGYTADTDLYSNIDFHGNRYFFDGWNPVWQDAAYWSKKLEDPYLEGQDYSNLYMLLREVSEETVGLSTILDMRNFYAWKIHSYLAGSVHQSNIANMRLLHDNTSGRFVLMPWDVGIDSLYKPEAGLPEFRVPEELLTPVAEIDPARVWELHYNPLVSSVITNDVYYKGLYTALWDVVGDDGFLNDQLAAYDRFAKEQYSFIASDVNAIETIDAYESEIVFQRATLIHNYRLLQRMLNHSDYSVSRDGTSLQVTASSMAGVRVVVGGSGGTEHIVLPERVLEGNFAKLPITLAPNTVTIPMQAGDNYAIYNFITGERLE